jgi:multiple sugar transport system permease protein
MMRESITKPVLIGCGAATLLVFALSPFVWMTWVSIVSQPDFLWRGSADYTIVNYLNVLRSPSLHFPNYFGNSLLVSTVTAVVVTLITSFAGYAVSRLRFPGRIMAPLFVLAMSMFPQISIVGYLFRMFSSLGFINTYPALILPYIAWTVPLALWINMSYFAQIPPELDRAALVDGAGRAQVLLRVVLPLALPGVFSSFLLVFIQCFNEFLFAIMLTTDYHAQTLPVGIALFEGTHGEIPWGDLMAASVLGSVPLVVLTLICQRYIVAGLTGGAVKG